MSKPPKSSRSEKTSPSEAEEDEHESDLAEEEPESPLDPDLIGHEAVEPIPAPQERHLAPARDPVQRFIDEARRYARLDERQERDLIQTARDRGDRDAARTLVLHNLRLVVSIAYQYRRAWLNLLDLFQEGTVGLMEAVRRWDPDMGTRFGSYAAYWIRACILRFLMTNARLIHVGNTRAGRKLFFRLEKERQKLLAEGFDPTPKLLAARLDVSEEDLAEVSAHLASREVSLEPRPDEEGVPLAEKIATHSASPEQEAAREELSLAIRHLMQDFESKLGDDRERAVWREHLAAEGEPVALSALGARYGVTKQRMGQIAEKLKRQFRERVIAELGADIQMSWQRND
jgi:RNA polymerase sigma-32 factor